MSTVGCTLCVFILTVFASDGDFMVRHGSICSMWSMDGFVFGLVPQGMTAGLDSVDGVLTLGHWCREFAFPNYLTCMTMDGLARLGHRKDFDSGMALPGRSIVRQYSEQIAYSWTLSTFAILRCCRTTSVNV